ARGRPAGPPRAAPLPPAPPPLPAGDRHAGAGRLLLDGHFEVHARAGRHVGDGTGGRVDDLAVRVETFDEQPHVGRAHAIVVHDVTIDVGSSTTLTVLPLETEEPIGIAQA